MFKFLQTVNCDEEWLNEAGSLIQQLVESCGSPKSMDENSSGESTYKRVSAKTLDLQQRLLQHVSRPVVITHIDKRQNYIEALKKAISEERQVCNKIVIDYQNSTHPASNDSPLGEIMRLISLYGSSMSQNTNEQKALAANELLLKIEFLLRTFTK